MITTASGALEYVLNVGRKTTVYDMFFVCCELDTALGRHVITDRAYKRAGKHIKKLLGEHYTLNSWVYFHYPDARSLKAINPRKYKERMLATRLAWIEDMIKWHKANGD